MNNIRIKKPRCFVAMAFNHDDTDKIYDNHIKKVLQNNDIIPVIINRQESNDDINNQIIKQLNVCDFCIVDLTHARQSVYFEAGYAQRKVEVIYTVRSDHFKKNQPDNRRVHFDLQMKPIIKWRSIDDNSFSKRLEQRIKRTFLTKWEKSQNINLKLLEEQHAFLKKPIVQRLKAIREKTINKLHRNGYNLWYCENTPLYIEPGPYRNPSHLADGNFLFIAAKFKNRIGKITYIEASESFLLKKLKDYNYFFGPKRHFYAPKYTALQDKLTSIDDLYEHIILLSLKGIPDSRIFSALDSFSKIDNPTHFTLTTRYVDKIRNQPDLAFTRHTNFYFISSINSLTHLVKNIDSIIDKINRN